MCVISREKWCELQIPLLLVALARTRTQKMCSCATESIKPIKIKSFSCLSHVISTGSFTHITSKTLDFFMNLGLSAKVCMPHFKIMTQKRPLNECSFIKCNKKAQRVLVKIIIVTQSRFLFYCYFSTHILIPPPPSALVRGFIISTDLAWSVLHSDKWGCKL